MIDMKKKAEDILEDYSNSYSQVDLETLAKFLCQIEAEAIREFAEMVNPIIEEIVDIMFDDNKSKCMIKNCHKHSSIPCESPTCIEENKAYWKVRIYNHVKEMVGDSDER